MNFLVLKIKKKKKKEKEGKKVRSSTCVEIGGSAPFPRKFRSQVEPYVCSNPWLGESCPWSMTCTKITVSKKNKENSDENKLLTPPPIFGWAWDRECLISKTLYGPRICAQVEFEQKKKKINLMKLFYLVQLSL